MLALFLAELGEFSLVLSLKKRFKKWSPKKEKQIISNNLFEHSLLTRLKPSSAEFYDKGLFEPMKTLDFIVQPIKTRDFTLTKTDALKKPVVRRDSGSAGQFPLSMELGRT